ncbi:MAG: hypothetical protein WC862_04740 [Patescibacteria group bacterium]
MKKSLCELFRESAGDGYPEMEQVLESLDSGGHNHPLPAIDPLIVIAVIRRLLEIFSSRAKQEPTAAAAQRTPEPAAAPGDRPGAEMRARFAPNPDEDEWGAGMPPGAEMIVWMGMM